jgi:hypothetical protein
MPWKDLHILKKHEFSVEEFDKQEDELLGLIENIRLKKENNH